MSQPPPLDDAFVRSFVTRYTAAWNARDPEAVLALAIDDVTWIDPTIPGGIARGRAPVRAWLRAFFTTFPDVLFATLDDPDPVAAAYLSRDGRRVAVPWRCTATMLGPLVPPGVPPTGRSLSITGVDFYTFRDGLLATVRTITDLQEAGRQLGFVPAPGGLAERLGVLAMRAGAALRALAGVSGPARRRAPPRSRASLR